MRTKWFNAAKAKPARKGAYEWTCTVAPPDMLRWDGRKWWTEEWDGERQWGVCEDCKWRGLTAPAETQRSGRGAGIK